MPAATPGWGRLLRTRTVLAVIVVELLAAAAVAYGLWALRRQTLDGELRMLASLSASMAAQADSTLDASVAALQATRAELAQGRLVPGADSTAALLRSRAAALPKLRALTVFDAQGRALATTGEAVDARASVAAEDLLAAARGTEAPTIGVGMRTPEAAEGGVGVSMGWHDASGAFGGVLLLSAAPEALDGDFARIAPTPDISLSIYNRDRRLLSDGPGDGRAHLLPAAQIDALWTDPDAERPRLATQTDGRTRLVAAHRLHRYPLIVVITRDASAVLADWTDQAWLVGSFAASMLTVTLLLVLRGLREQALRRASQRALAAEQERAVRAFDAAQEGHWEWTPTTGQVHLSPRMKDLMGLARDEPLAGTLGPLASATLHPEDVRPLREAFVAHGRGETSVFDATFRVRRSDGGWRHVRARGHAWRDGAGRTLLYSGTGSDVSTEVEAEEHRRQLEDQLQRARKLEAIGTLAGGVAHDFNNILAAIVGYGELARSCAAPGSAQARQLDQVLRAGERGRALVERVLSFSRSAGGRRHAFLLQPVVDEVMQLLSASLPEGVRFVHRLQAPEAVIAGDTTLVFEAVMNLCTNGLQSMPDGGTLEVALQTVVLHAEVQLFERSLPAGRYARLDVTDDGSGIAPDVMTRLFEPFFTTKEPRHGTGLGLAVVHGVMADLGGAIDVHNLPGHGARFTLFFPCVDGPPDAEPPATADAPSGEGQTVMVVDDEPALVALAEELLADLGYEPVGFEGSEKALAAFRAAPDRFDLLFTDEVMPQMSGTALATALHGLRPQLPVVLASGYGGPQLEDRAAAAGVTVLVKKPLRRAELARALERALAPRRRPTAS
jgi:PAS domain S-box-containing protein